MKKATNPLSFDLRAGGFEVFPLAKVFLLPSNVSFLIQRNLLAEPLAAWAANALYELGCLKEMGHILKDHRICYSPDNKKHGDWLRPDHFAQRLTLAKTQEIIARVIRNAEKANADPSRDFNIESLGIFGSVLRDADSPGDVDIVFAACWRDDNTPLPEASYHPFRSREPVDYVSGDLARGSRRMDLSSHYILEVEKIGAPYRIIWTRKEGRVDRPIVTPEMRQSKEEDDESSLAKAEFARANAFTNSFRTKCESLPPLAPPKTPPIDPATQPMTKSKWIQSLEENHPVVDLAHALCLPPGALKHEIDSMLQELFQTDPSRKLTAHKMLSPYLAASALYGKWEWDPRVGLRKAR
jgi:hypothetical protein